LKWDRRQSQVWLATVGVLMVAHVAEVMTWSLANATLDAVPAGTDILYFAFVNYTMLGYGDVVPVERWRLLGPIAAMNGVLLFGWSTAVIFEVMRQAMRTREKKRAVISMPRREMRSSTNMDADGHFWHFLEVDRTSTYEGTPSIPEG
jgi:polyferredoxin